MSDDTGKFSDARKKRKTATKSEKIRKGMREVANLAPSNPHKSNSFKDLSNLLKR